MGNRSGAVEVAIVDDHTLFAETLRLMVDTTDGYSVVGMAQTGAEGVALVTGSPVDVVLMDYRLPDMDGVEATSRILAVRPGCRVIMLTASGDDERVAAAALEAGCCGYVGKDTPFVQLLAAVDAAIAGQAFVGPGLLARVVEHRERRQLAPVAALSQREQEVLALLADGHADQVIGERLGISGHTARTHVRNILTKLGAHSRLEAVAVARRHGMLREP